jgi:light-regulated signal transduction histidine kinase (bacteriophytochrome)
MATASSNKAVATKSHWENRYDAVLAQVLSDLEFRIQKAGARVECAAALPAVQGDRLQLCQLFQNLIGNAVKFHKPGKAPLVRVRAAASDGFADIVVSAAA